MRRCVGDEAAAEPADSTNWCPTYRPTRQQFSRPFCDYVREIFKRDPDLPMFKVIPPKGWKPYKQMPDLEEIRIDTPIKQHAFGKSGAYMCILEEQRAMTAAEYKKMAENPAKQPPAKSRRGDELHERAFWSSVSVNPPLYGADTPISLFDEKLEYGWNFRCLENDLLREYDVPQIAGVTTPMTYFGMWKSFSGWHKEDMDLYSINYLHCGATKVWYCVSPKDNPRFDAMTRALFPENFSHCHAFMRHKDIVISPKVLRSYGVSAMMAKQEQGEFVVINAAAYHAVYNTGFNCAEAVNFALPEWLEVGRDCVQCDCEALADVVSIDMGIFFPELREDDSSDEEEEGDSEEEDNEGSEEEESEAEEQQAAETSGLEGDEDTSDEEWEAGSKRRRRTAAVARQQPAATRRKRGAAAAAAAAPPAKKSRSGQRRLVGDPPATPRLRAVPPVGRTARPEDCPKAAVHSSWGRVAEGRPVAVVEREEGGKELRYHLVHRLAKDADKPGCLWVGLLEQGPDGLFRPSRATRCMTLGSSYPRLARPRAEWVDSDGSKAGQRAAKAGWRLLTKPERILM